MDAARYTAGGLGGQKLDTLNLPPTYNPIGVFDSHFVAEQKTFVVKGTFLSLLPGNLYFARMCKILHDLSERWQVR